MCIKYIPYIIYKYAIDYNFFVVSDPDYYDPLIGVCPEPLCTQQCENGYVRNDRGCQTCECGE